MISLVINYDRDSPAGREARQRAHAIVAAFVSKDNSTTGNEIARTLSLPADEIAATVDALAELARGLAIRHACATGTSVMDVLKSVGDSIEESH